VPATRPAAKKERSAAKTNPPAPTPQTGFIANWREFIVPMGVLGIVMAMITPLPPFLMDVLISANITLSVIVLLVSLYIAKPVDFSVFPTTLLLMTLFRLALNISSARLILLYGNTGTSAAGDVIQAFGAFVVGGNYIIGVVIFLVLIAIQYVVINHGAVRISEVTARFTLDALPGKQMSVDSDLNAGLIDENEARAKRKMLASEAEFYGAMDGASRFTQRDAVASILITSINIIAGFLIGVLQHGMDLQRALQTYTVLTIGDGLVTVIPALMISISGGLIITRTSSETKLGIDFQRQVFSNAHPLMLASGVLVALAAFPGLPKIPFLVLGGGVGFLAWRVRAKNCQWRSDESARSRAGAGEPGRAAQGRTAGGRSRPRPGSTGGGRTEFAFASEDRQHPEAVGHRTRLYCSTGAGHR
jgi:flagellar biosynthesis protein FlhA